MRTAILVVSDLMFQSKIADALRALGVDPRTVDSDDAVGPAVSDAAALAVVDLHDRAVEALAAIRTLAAAGVPVLAFGRHTEPGLLRAARDAGAATAVPRSQLVEELPDLLRGLMAPM